MRELVRLLFLCQALLRGTDAFQWAHSIANGTTLQTCAGHNVTFGWNFTADVNEHVIDIQWFYKADGQAPQLLATMVAGNFFVTPHTGKHVQLLPSAGITLSRVTSADKGVYYVDVNVNSPTSYSKVEQNVMLEVLELPVLPDHRLHASLLPETEINNSTGEAHARLACGDFQSLGNPPVSVVWRTPSNDVRNSTTYENGSFILELANEAASGDYSCYMDRESPALSCSKNTSSLYSEATVSVNGLELRLSVLEAERLFYKKQTDSLKSEKEELSRQLQNVTNIAQQCTETFSDARRPVDCKGVLAYDKISGVYALYIGQNRTAVLVYCDQTTDQGGWTVFQRRFDGSVVFDRDWLDYEDGFGHVYGEYWLGLRNIYQMTSRGVYTLRVDLEDFSGNTAYAEYSHFSISGPEDNYRLHVSGYRGTTGNDTQYGMINDSNMQFTTRDRDHDLRDDANCAARFYRGGFWYSTCGSLNPNGVYKNTAVTGLENSMSWYPWRDYQALRRVEMKIRPA